MDIHLECFHGLKRAESDYEAKLNEGREGRKRKYNKKIEKPTCSKKRKSDHILLLHHPLSKEQRSFFKIPKTDRFRYYYKTSKDLLQDFERWLVEACRKTEKAAKEIASSCKQIWLVIDEKMCLNPNQLADPENLEDVYLIPQVKKLEANEKNHFEATTLRSKLGCINKLLQFSKIRAVFFGLDFQQLDIMDLKIQELSGGLKSLILERYHLEF